ncbi:MAG: hypothetical protein LBJ65_04975 [Burkholderia sp.]|uniref:hypothetical protein n=1 Tax=Burkholderia sp. TaxID=36773 RepID=UPI002819E7AB|nr:hypothetical protein [Burkholderia sp.]MDR0240942.1 hypothetical protein [Burkholderia sp.]
MASAVYMNDEKHTSLFKDMAGGYVMYNGALAIYSSQWKTEKQFTANIKITISNKDIKDWPAIGIRAGNYTNGDDIGEKSGVAYIRYGEDQGVCTIVVEPELPPPPVEIAIGMSAPDWSLGDLPRGTSEKTLSKTADQLCFTYSGPAVKDKKFVINASNANGFVDKNYRLNNLDDASKFVPYSIALNSGASTLSLPNSADTALPLDSSGKTCFVPTFKTTVDAQAKDGDYSDVLTFTVVTKP